MKQEGIDKRYSQLILQELSEATDMTNDQLNQAADELLHKSPTSTPTNGSANKAKISSPEKALQQQSSYLFQEEKYTNQF